jgi:hypothetical protein
MDRPALHLEPSDSDDFEPDGSTWDDAVWDEIIDSTQPDIDAGIYAFSTDGCKTDEEVRQAVWNWLCTLGNGDSDEPTDSTEIHPAGQ